MAGESRTLTLKKPPDPAKIALSQRLGFRFVDRKGRYLLQAQLSGEFPPVWVDVPLVPELP